MSYEIAGISPGPQKASARKGGAKRLEADAQAASDGEAARAGAPAGVEDATTSLADGAPAGTPSGEGEIRGRPARRNARATPLTLVVGTAEGDALEELEELEDLQDEPGVEESVEAEADDDLDARAPALASSPTPATTQTPATTAAAAPEPADDEATRPSVLARARRLVAGNFIACLLVLVVVGLAVALALTMLQVGNQNAVNNARTTSVAAAKTYAVEIAGYDYRHLNTDFGVVLANSTPSFRTSFSQSSNALKSTLTKYHATATAKVVATALVSATTSRAVVLVLLDQTVTNTEQKAPTTDRSQVEITLVSTNGKWLIDQVTLL